jgi:DNA-binding transcriptional LysR family regulator
MTPPELCFRSIYLRVERETAKSTGFRAHRCRQFKGVQVGLCPAIPTGRAIRTARLAADGKLGLLRIGFISTVGSEIVPDIVRQFRALNLELEFSLRNILTADQIQMLETGSLDIGFLRLPIGGYSALDVVTVHREPFVQVVPSSHKLAKRKRVRLHEVSGENFVMYERAYTPRLHDVIFGMLRDAGSIPNVSQTAGDLSTVISLVDAHMGIAISPA